VRRKIFGPKKEDAFNKYISDGRQPQGLYAPGQELDVSHFIEPIIKLIRSRQESDYCVVLYFINTPIENNKYSVKILNEIGCI
jgi:hypothetical protein